MLATYRPSEGGFGDFSGVTVVWERMAGADEGKGVAISSALGALRQES
jgi:hypothetical protein